MQAQLARLDPDERIAYLLMDRFCEEYDNAFHEPYWPGREALREPADHPCFAAFVGVAMYLRERGIAIGNRDLPWQGYVAYAMRNFAERGHAPCPGQLKNPVLLRRYLESKPVVEDVEKIPVDYRKIVAPWLRDPESLRFLGLL